MNPQLVYEAESYVLGCILIEPDLIFECKLQPHEFTDSHKLIMEYFRYLQENDKRIDIMIMAETSGSNLQRIGGIPYLTKLASSVPTTSSFNHYQSIVRRAFLKRRASETLGDFSQISSSEDVDAKELIANVKDAFEQLADIADSGEQQEMVPISQVLKGHEKVIMKRLEQRGITGAHTASEELDRLTGGHQDGEFDVIAARPSIGKTAYMINDAVKSARGGRTVGIFSLEMSSLQIAERFICAIGNIDSAKIRTGNMSDLDWEHWSKAVEELDRLPILIDDTSGRNIQQIGAKVRQLKKMHPNLVIYLDFLQLISPGKKFTNPHEGVAYVSRTIKQIARQNNCPMVAISAVGRSVEQRQDKRPLMSDLRDSGSIESDADTILFLYRDDYYNAESSKRGLMELILAKGRNVGVGTIEMVFNKRTGRFSTFVKE